MTGIVKKVRELEQYHLIGYSADFNNIPCESCWGQWYGSQGVKNAPAQADGYYFKLGNIIVACNGWNSTYFIRSEWVGWKNWKQL